MQKDKKELLRLRVEDPYAILGICMYLNEKGYEVCGLHVFGKLNIIGMLRQAHLNHWIDITPEWNMVNVESGDTSVEEFLNSKGSDCYNHKIFITPDELFDYLKINETI